MIGSLRGIVVIKAPPFLMVEVNGVGYELEAPMTTFYKLPSIGEPVLLYTHMVVREDAQNLFGFYAESDRTLFRSLIRVNGVGPKLALAILSGVGVEVFYRSIQNHDAAALVRLPGIGKKTAERLIIEMQDKLPDSLQDSLDNAPVNQPETGTPSPLQEAVSALIALGYKPEDASRMVRKIPDRDMNCEEIIRLALQAG